jgi:hypothetical protein
MIFQQSDDELIESYKNLLSRQKRVTDPDILELITGKLIIVSQELQLRHYTQDESLAWQVAKKQSDINGGSEEQSLE